MSLQMSLQMSSKLYTEEEIGFERVIEIRIVDLKARDGKQRSFSLSAKKGAKDYPSLDRLKQIFEGAMRKVK